MRQLHFDPEVNELNQRQELWRGIRRRCAALGWTPDDLDVICVETFGEKFGLLTHSQLEALAGYFARFVKQ